MLDYTQVKKYFARINQSALFEAFMAGDTKPSLAMLREILFHHELTFPFENVDMHNVILNPTINPIPIELGAIVDKMLEKGRGGYCFETNELLRQVLLFLKFDVKAFNAGVLWMKPAKLPPGHEVLIVNLEGNEYLVEPGFGSPGPLEPLLFRENGKLYDQEQVFEKHEVKRFRFIVDEDGEFQLQGQVNVNWRPDTLWKPLYAFKTGEECSAREFAECNAAASASERSPFLERLFVTIPFLVDAIRTGRKTLTQSFFKVSTPTSVTESSIQTQKHFFDMLASEFNIHLPAGSALTAKQVTFQESDDLQSQLAAMLSTPAEIPPPIVAPTIAAVAPAFTSAQQNILSNVVPAVMEQNQSNDIATNRI